METNQEIAISETRFDLAVSRQPEVVLEEARQAAKALQNVIAKKERPVMFNGQQYLELEDWQTVGRFYGVSVKVVEGSSKLIQVGDVVGYEARAVVMRLSDGMEISGAEAMCLNDEPNWAKKPLFQLRSMAQTRACSKAFRNVLAWVVVLAGYKPTPAEEMEGVHPVEVHTAEPQPSKPPVQPPQRKSTANGTGQTFRDMKSKYNGLCGGCNQEIKVGMDIKYNGDTKKAWHPDCVTAAA